MYLTRRHPRRASGRGHGRGFSPGGFGGDDPESDHSCHSDDRSSGEDDDDIRVSRMPRSRIKLQKFDKSLGTADGHTSKTALRTLVAVNETN